MAKTPDPLESAKIDGTYDELHTPLNAPKADADPQGQLDNAVIPIAKSSAKSEIPDPQGYLGDLTGPRGRRGDPK